MSNSVRHIASVIAILFLLIERSIAFCGIGNYEQTEKSVLAPKLHLFASIIQTSAIEILSSVHPLPIVFDATEVAERESEEDDDDSHAHERPFLSRRISTVQKSVSSSTFIDCLQLATIPLYILHHSWKQCLLPLV